MSATSRALLEARGYYPIPSGGPEVAGRAVAAKQQHAFKYGAAWSRTDALTPPSEEEVETAAIKLWQSKHPDVPWDYLFDRARDHVRAQARAALSAFLDHRRNA